MNPIKVHITASPDKGEMRPAILDPEHYPEDREDEGDCSPAHYSPLDELCVRMLSLGAMGGCGGGTDHLKAFEIKTLLVPFFGLDRVNRCLAALCEESSQAQARPALHV